MEEEEDKSSKEDKIRKIVETHFDEEINYKKYELEKINDRIFEAQNMLDKLRVCIICNYYSLNGRLNLNEYVNHPSIANLKCEHLDLAIDHIKPQANGYLPCTLNRANEESANNENDRSIDFYSSYTQQFEVKIGVGNVSKSLTNNPSSKKQSEQKQLNTSEPSQYDQNLITHKWMVYIRSSDCPKLDNYIKKVIFFLHSSYKPYDMIEIKSPPFQLIKRGWGEFPVHAQIHFKDPRNKRLDITHHLKLDWTQTGLQTFGGETASTSRLIVKPNDFLPNQTSTGNDQANRNKLSSSSAMVNEASSPSSYYYPILEQSQDTNIIHQSYLNVATVQQQQQQQQPEAMPISNLQRNLSSSSLCSSTNSSSNMNVNDKIGVSPSNFISFESAKSNTPTACLIDENRQETAKPVDESTIIIDDLIMNFCSEKPEEEKQPAQPQHQQQLINATSSAESKPSIDTLLNLRPLNQISKTNISLINIKPSIPSIVTVNKTISATPASFASGCKLTNPFSFISPVVRSNPSNSSVSVFNHGLNQKSTVIYKVGAIDLKNVNPEQQQSQNLPAYKIFNTNESITQSPAPSQQPMNNEIQSQTKKLKLSSEQLTKIKNAQSGIPTVQKIIETIKSTSPKQTVSEVCQTKPINNNEAVSDRPQQTHVYSLDSLIASHSQIGSHKLLSFETVLKVVLKHFPIVIDSHLSCSTESDSRYFSKQKLPFTATSLDEFYSWPYGKRKASEWIRAVHVRNKCIEILSNLNISKPIFWTTKQVLFWLRANGHTPLEMQHVNFSRRSVQTSPRKQNGSSGQELEYVDSFSSVSKLAPHLADCLFQENSVEKTYGAETLQEIDVESLENKSDKLKKKVERVLNSDEEGIVYDEDDDDDCYSKSIEMCEGSKYVKEQLSMFNIKTYPINLIASQSSFLEEKNDWSSVIKCNLVENFIYAACKRFAEDLVRQTCSDNYAKPSNLNLAGGVQQFPKFLYVKDIYNTMVAHDRYDFLTNKHMARDCDTSKNQ